jgi:predicted DNA-binding antitoxin AbrB/MazE fold protein
MGHVRISLVVEGEAMPITVEAVYENGVLKLEQPLPLKEHEKVRVTVQPGTPPGEEPADEAERIVRRSYGLLGWTGDVATLRRLATDPEFDPQESA